MTLTDPWRPALLHLIARTARDGQDAGKPVGVCGEAAADPLLACVLGGSLSAAPAAVPAVGVALSRVTVDDCRRAADAAAEADDPAAARSAARAALVR